MTSSMTGDLRKATVSKTFGVTSRLLVGLFLCAVLLVWGPPSEAQTDDDDDDMSGGALAVLLLAVDRTVLDLQGVLPPASQMQLDRLLMAVQEAALAEAEEERARELTWLGKAIGAVKALMGMTSSCDECGDVQDDLQELLGILARERARIAGTPRSCRPDGVISKWEECDPVARPTGCEAFAEATFCDVDCKCEPVP